MQMRAVLRSGRAGEKIIRLDADVGRHQSISMVEEPTKTLRGALAFFRGASCSIKSRDPIKARSDELVLLFRVGSQWTKQK